MIRSRALRITGWRLSAAVLLTAAILAASGGVAIAGPLPPITPIFPPWITGYLTASMPATVTGTVQNGLGSPIASATVVIYGHTDSTAIEAQNFLQKAVTGPDGKFVITDVIQGTYEMTVNDQLETPTVAAYREDYPWHDWTDNGLGGTDNRQYVTGGTTVDTGVIHLKHNGVVNGRAIYSATPIAGSQVTAVIVDPTTNMQYYRWATTGSDGRFSIANAPPGDWTLTYDGVGQYVPTDPTPMEMNGTDYDPIARSAPETFTVLEGATVTRSNHVFEPGQLLTTGNWETYGITSFNVSGIQVTATLDTDPYTQYSWTTLDPGFAHTYLPPGEYDLQYSDSLGCYDPLDVGSILATSGAANLDEMRQLTPASGTHAVHGHITEGGTGNNVESWLTMTYVDPAASAPPPARRLLSDGLGQYVMRVPADTGLPGNQVSIEINDRTAQIPSTTMYEPPTHVAQSFTMNVSADTTRDVIVPVGGSISGQVTDDHGDPVRGVTVSAQRKGLDASWAPPQLAWLNSLTPISSPWVTLTDGSGHYTIGGLPADHDYKVTFNPDYNPGWPLNIAYRDYNRRLYHDRQLADGLNSMVSPPVIDHDSVVVATGTPTTGIDTQLRPGGYVALHADGPEYPTGAVYCDVMYDVGGVWSEVDSGFTTGGTFHKDWKVLPAGTYRLDYSDYFGRGAGSWSFDLAEDEHKYASVLVPAPLTFLSANAGLSGSFEGLINDGLADGGTGGAQLSVLQLPAVPATAPPPPANYISSGGIYDFSASGATLNGIWTLTMPYDPAVPDANVGSLRVRHLKGDGTAEILVPYAWNTVKHTLQVQTTALSPFQVMFNRTKVSLSKPSTPLKLHRNQRFNVTGLLTPRHSPGAKSVRLYVYKWSHGRWVVTSKPWTKNSTFHGATRWSVSLKLGKGKYRLTPVAPADTWHLATTGPYKAITIK